MSEWTLPLAGGCRCGAVCFEISQPSLLASACHCTGCQHMTASAFSLTLTVPAEGFAVTRGETVIGGLHGPEVHHHHCAHCKGWIHTQAEGLDWFVNVRATLLDDPDWFAPFIEVWTSEGLPWARTGAPHSFATQPEIDEYEELRAGYAKQGSTSGECARSAKRIDHSERIVD